VAKPSQFGHEFVVVGQLKGLASTLIMLAEHWKKENCIALQTL
jgi:ABC-type thiamin/hydroxymethylpyrimidine transport system permease subunit